MFSALLHTKDPSIPPRDVEALSCIVTSPLISCFDAPLSQQCKMSQPHTKHTSCFVHIDDSLMQLVHPMATSQYLFFSQMIFYTSCPALLPHLLNPYVPVFQSFLFLSSLLSNFLLHFSFPFLILDSYTAVRLTSPLCFPRSTFFSLLSASINIPINAEQLVIIFVLHCACLIGFMPVPPPQKRTLKCLLIFKSNKMYGNLCLGDYFWFIKTLTTNLLLLETLFTHSVQCITQIAPPPTSSLKSPFYYSNAHAQRSFSRSV